MAQPQPTVLLPEPMVAQGTAEEPTIIVRPMLTTTQKNFRDLQHPPSVLSPSAQPTEITRDDLDVPGARCFLLHALLSPEECRHYIEETEKIGYSDLSGLFPREYRSNERVLAICQPLVECLWTRLQPHLSRREVVRVRPIGFGNEGTWKPFRLNECCKFGKYKAGGHFSPHLDGPWVPHEDESSVFTVVVYLNSDFQGGGTRFLDENDKKEVCFVSPKAGTALIFNHDTLHEGLPVTEGVKYIIRTEVMYRRVDREMIPDPLSYKRDENYLTTLALYQKSWQLEQEGDSQGFTDTYLEAIRRQREAQRSVGSDTADIFQQALPYEIYMRIFSNLSAHDVCQAMRVCKVWYDMAMDGQLWYDLYRKQWPIGIGLEAQLDHTKKTLVTAPPPFIKDWYGLYKQRVMMDSPAKVMVVDLGSFSCKCAVVDRVKSHIKTATIESVVALVPGVFDTHMRVCEWERYYCGKDAKETFPNHVVNVIEKGIPVKAELLPEIITGFYYSCHVRPKYAPVVILEPPGLWDGKICSEVAYTFVKLFQQSSVSFLSSAVATLCGVEYTSGVVVDVGHGVATCCAVWEGEECPGSTLCDPLECTAPTAAKMVHALLAACSKETRAVLQERVVVTGGKAPNGSAIERELQKIDSKYCVIEPRSAVYGGVGGGCMLTSLNNFSARQDASALKILGSHPVKVMKFYHMFCKHWCSYIVTEDEDGSKDDSTDDSKEADSKPDQETDEGMPDLEMAGVSCPVSGLLVEAKGFCPNAVQIYLDMVNAPSGWIDYNNDDTFVDSVFEDKSEDESEDDSEDESESAKEADSKPDQETDDGTPDL